MFSLAVMLGNITTGLASERKGELDFLGSIRSSVVRIFFLNLVNSESSIEICLYF